MVSETPEGGLTITFSRADLVAMPGVDSRILRTFVGHMFDVCGDVPLIGKPKRPDVSEVFEPITQP